jgi:hypothetical protein
MLAIDSTEMEKPALELSGISDLIQAIQDTNQFFLRKVQRQVNTSLTLRNWVIGYYIAEYEQQGKDRAEYGETLYTKIAERLKAVNLGSILQKLLPHLPTNIADTVRTILSYWFSRLYNFADTVSKISRQPGRTSPDRP